MSSDERTAAPGVLNEFYIGRNEDPDSKNDAFLTATRGAIGEQPVLMFKYCYVDVDEKTDPQKLFAHYRETVGKLRMQHPNATILHYPDSERQMNAGDLLLVDAACNYEYMSGDITRTYPVNGVFSPLQKDLYAIVLKAQDEAMQIGKSGATT